MFKTFLSPVRAHTPIVEGSMRWPSVFNSLECGVHNNRELLDKIKKCLYSYKIQNKKENKCDEIGKMEATGKQWQLLRDVKRRPTHPPRANSAHPSNRGRRRGRHTQKLRKIPSDIIPLSGGTRDTGHVI